MIEVLVDGFPVPVDEAEYLADPEAVEQSVREARAELNGPLDDEPFPDYDTLVAVAEAGFGA